MARHGLICSTVRQAVDAVENKESACSRLGLEMGLWRTSVAYGFVFDDHALIDALRD